MLFFLGVFACSARAEAPFAFRARLVEVHRPNRCDRALKPVDGAEYAFVDGCVVPDADFADYLNVSMNVKARVGADGAVKVRIDPALPDRACRVEVGRHGVAIVAKDERAKAQAFYHLEDLMNLRRAPFLRYGVENRRMRFSPRMLHSGYDVDVFPDGHLAQMAHYGFDAIAVFMKTPEKSESASGEVDVNDIIRRAKAHGLDTYLYTKIKAFVHPSDPKAPEVFASTYGRLARLHPGAKGIVFVGESCEFPSKDPRTTGKSYRDTEPGDTRPPPGWFPCNDYPDWINAVKAAVQKEAPQMEIVFWTYNWGPQPAELRVPMVEKFPRDVIMQGTYYKTPADPKRNGLCLPCEDYTISFAGPGGNVVEESAAAKRSGKRFYAMTNTGGLTWDFGCAPYEPFPYQWKKRFDGMVKMSGEGRLAGLMESHHYGWYPNFIAELAKEAFTEGGLPFDEHLRAIAVREFGDANADRALAAWKAWSEAIGDYPGTNDNQYGPFRLGPAYPFNFGGPTIAPVFSKDKAPAGSVPFPQPKGVMHPMTWMCDLNWRGAVGRPPDAKARGFDREKEVELLSAMAGKLDEGTRLFKSMSGAGAAHMANLGEYLTRSTVTGLNVKRGCLAFAAGDTNRIAAIARDEYENAKGTLPLLARDSRLGWEPSMGYAGGADVVRWKLDLMRKVYGFGESARYGSVRADVSALPADRRFVGDLLETRVRERIPEGEGGTLAVKLVLDAGVPGEEARVTVAPEGAEVRAGRFHALVSGVGNLLKSFRYGRGSFVAYGGRYDFRPAKSLRIAYLARHFINGYMEMGADEFCRYVDDLVLDGINAFNTQLGMPAVDAARVTSAERERFLAVSRRVGARISRLDCTLVASGGGNQLPTDSPEEYRAEPNVNPKCPPTGFNACPGKPKALAALLDRREKAVRDLAGYDVGYFTNWPYDEGGCGCGVCRPWGGNGYLKLIERFRDINSAAFPKAKRIVSTWFFDDADYEGMWKYLETHDWIDYLLVDDFGKDYPKYPLEHPIPNGKTRIITFPEISMWGRVPWGGYGATALPKFLESLFRQSERIADGFEYYSEGIYEDINKAIVTGLYVDPSDSTDAILRRYGAYHFAGADPDDFVALANLLEANHRQTLMTPENVAAAKALAERIDRAMLPTLRGSWRWRIVWLRTMIDAKPENRYFDELVRLYHAERQLRWVLDGKMGGWTCPKYVPDGDGYRVYAPPEGDATDMLQKLLDDTSLVEVHLGAGTWRHGPLVLRHSRFDLVLEEGCRLSAPVTIAKSVDGATVRGDRDRRVTVEDGARNVVVDGVRIDTPDWTDAPCPDRAAEIQRIDKLIEWADQHAEKEKVEFLKGRLREVQRAGTCVTGGVFAVRRTSPGACLAATSGPAVPEGADALYDPAADILCSLDGRSVIGRDYLAKRYGIPYAPMNPRPAFRTPPVGWMTWYAVKFKASDDVVMDNARRFKEAFGDYVDERPVLWVDWEWYHEKMYSAGEEGHDLITPRKTAYPRGMRAVSDDLRKLGFVPALWVSAICDVRTNALWKAHPEWILGERRNWSGGVWGDPTAPGFCEKFIPEIFRRYRDEWGYEAFKWDTVPNALVFLGELRDRMHDPTVAPEDAFRRMVSAARKALGPGVYLESCAAIRDRDVLSMIDLFDSGRVGDDIFGWAEFCRNGVDRLLRFFPFHSTAFWADADNLVLRREFSDEAQARTRVSVYGLAGVPVTLGDAMSDLDATRVDMLRRIMPVVPVRPASLERGRLTGTDFDMQVDFARDFGRWQVRAWSNLATNRTRTVRFNTPKDAVAWDYWNDRLLTERTFAIAPCDTKVVRITALAAQGPTLVSVSRHLTQGGYELASYSSDRTGARGVVRCPGGETVKVSFLLPDGASPKAASHPYERQGRLLRLRLFSKERADVRFGLSL